MQKKWYQSANFYIALVLAIGGFFIGFPENAAKDTVAALFALIAGGGVIYQFAKARPATKGKAWFTDGNFWNYVTTVVVSLLPTFGGELIEPVRQIAESLLGGNWNGAIIGAISLVTILIKIFRKPNPT